MDSPRIEKAESGSLIIERQKLRPSGFKVRIIPRKVPQPEDPSFLENDNSKPAEIVERLNDISIEEPILHNLSLDSQSASLAIPTLDNTASIWCNREGWWEIPHEYPKFVEDLIVKSLAHETSINPDIRSSAIRISSRLVFPWDDQQQDTPHTDGPEHGLHEYFFVLGAATIQYMPKTMSEFTRAILKLRNQSKDSTSKPIHQGAEFSKRFGFPSSSIPQKALMVAYTKLFPHSQQWELFPSEGESGNTLRSSDISKARYFFRLSVSDGKREHDSYFLNGRENLPYRRKTDSYGQTLKNRLQKWFSDQPEFLHRLGITTE